MANQTASGFSITTDTTGAKTLVVHGQSLNYVFPYTGNVPVMPSDIAALQAHEDAQVATAMQQVLTAVQGVSNGSAEGTPPVTTVGGTSATTTPAGGTSTAGTPSTGTTGTTTATTGTTPPAPAAGQAAITVGPGQAIAEICDAIPLIAPGGTITALDATYVKSFHCEVPGVTIKSASGNPRKCVVDGQGGYATGHRMAWGKAMFHFGAPATVNRIGFVNCGAKSTLNHDYSNEAAIYAETFTAPGKLAVIECTFDNNGNGIFVPPGDIGSKIDVLSQGNVMGYKAPNGQSYYAATQQGGPSHDHYVGGNSLEVTGNYQYGNVGHSVKSRCKITNVHDNPLLTADGGRAVEAPDAGQLTVKNNNLVHRSDRDPQGGLYSNANFLAYGIESQNNGVQNPVLDGNTMNITRQNSTIFTCPGSTMQVTNNTLNLFGSGSLQLQGNVSGLSQASAPPGAPATYTLPQPPAWAL